MAIACGRSRYLGFEVFEGWYKNLNDFSFRHFPRLGMQGGDSDMMIQFAVKHPAVYLPDRQKTNNDLKHQLYVYA